MSGFQRLMISRQQILENSATIKTYFRTKYLLKIQPAVQIRTYYRFTNIDNDRTRSMGIQIDDVIGRELSG
jgi:hypothetical protein